MLVLSRQRDETIMIGDDIEVTVVDIRGDKVRLGINAPKEISVHRKEVYDAIRRENRAAADPRQHRRAPQSLGQKARHQGGADIPGHMAKPVGASQPKFVQVGRNDRRRVIANQQNPGISRA